MQSVYFRGLWLKLPCPIFNTIYRVTEIISLHRSLSLDFFQQLTSILTTLTRLSIFIYVYYSSRDTSGSYLNMQRVSAHLARVSARIEATLSTHGFTALFLVIYGLSVALMFLWGFWTEFDSPKNIENEPLLFRWLIGCARGAGYTLNLNTALVLLLASRLFLTALRDTALGDVLPLDKSFPVLHIVVAYTILASLFIHVPFHFAWIGNFNRWTPGLWQFNMSVATGVALMLVFGILFVFARPWMRKKHFRVFYIVHLTGAFLFFSLLIFHGMYNGRPETYKYVIPPLIIYILDRIIRLTNMSTHNLELSAENSVFKDDNILQLSIPKPFNFRPGQYAGEFDYITICWKADVANDFSTS